MVKELLLRFLAGGIFVSVFALLATYSASTFRRTLWSRAFSSPGYPWINHCRARQTVRGVRSSVDASRSICVCDLYPGGMPGAGSLETFRPYNDSWDVGSVVPGSARSVA